MNQVGRLEALEIVLNETYGRGNSFDVFEKKRKGQEARRLGMVNRIERLPPREGEFWGMVPDARYSIKEDRYFFPDQESAALALDAVVRAVERNPLSPDAVAYVEHRARLLRKEMGDLQGSIFSKQGEMRELEKLAQANGLDLTFRLDAVAEADELIKFFQEEIGDKAYEVFGKDFYRSLQAKLKRIVAVVDPIAAERL